MLGIVFSLLVITLNVDADSENGVNHCQAFIC